MKFAVCRYKHITLFVSLLCIHVPSSRLIKTDDVFFATGAYVTVMK